MMFDKKIKQFLIKFGFITTPFLLILLLYIYNDPFKVINTYNQYNNHPMYLNQGYVCWQTYLNNKDSIHYNSFIFGNSCSTAFSTCEWKKYLNKDATPIVLYNNGESIYAICKKIQCLDKHGSPINNALIILDKSTLQNITPQHDHSHILHPDISGKNSLFVQNVFISGFFIPKVLGSYLSYSITGKYKKRMRGIIVQEDDIRNPVTNDLPFLREKEFNKLSDKYWVNHSELFKTRTKAGLNLESSIGGRQIKLLHEISTILKKHNTNFKIIINPEWNQRNFNPEDLKILHEIFGEDRIFNFSGKNKHTDNLYNFYDKGHYRPILGKTILDSIYSNSGKEVLN